MTNEAFHAGGNGKGWQFGATQKGLETIVELWVFTLQWISDHPFLFLVTLLFLLAWIHLRQRGQTERRRLELEFKEARERHHTPRLPLNEQGGHPKIGRAQK